MAAAASPHDPIAEGLNCHTNLGILCECQCRPTLHLADVGQTPALTLAEGGSRDRGAGQGGHRGDGNRIESVLYHEDGGIATLTLNRPKVRVCVCVVEMCAVLCQSRPA